VGIFLHSYRNCALDVWRFSTTGHYHICHRSFRLSDRVGYTLVFTLSWLCRSLNPFASHVVIAVLAVAARALLIVRVEVLLTAAKQIAEKVFRSNRHPAFRILHSDYARGGTSMKYLLSPQPVARSWDVGRKGGRNGVVLIVRG
jgi:hypothetical protein